MAKSKDREKIYLKVRTVERKQPTNDYLKFYKVVRHWAKKKYNISGADLDMIQFLYSERLFSRTDFDEYNNIFHFDPKRFNKLLRDGWIRKVRVEGMGRCALYDVSTKGKGMMIYIYKLLNEEVDFAESVRRNPVMKKSAGFADKTYAQIMKMINKRNKKRRLEPTRIPRDDQR